VNTLAGVLEADSPSFPASQTPFSSEPPLPPLPLSEPAALALADPDPPQAKAQLSKDMPDGPLQSG